MCISILYLCIRETDLQKKLSDGAMSVSGRLIRDHNIVFIVINMFWVVFKYSFKSVFMFVMMLKQNIQIWVFPKIKVGPQNGWFFSMENPMNKWMIWWFSQILGNTHTSWWFQPICKICSSNWILSPNRDKHKKIFETTSQHMML